MKRFFSFFIVLCLLLTTLSIPAAAAPSASASVSASTVLVGNTVTVTFTFTADKPIGAAEPRITYNPNVFSYESLKSGGTAAKMGNDAIMISYFDTNGVGVSAYKVEAVFKAIAVGDGTFAVNFPSLGLHTAESEYLGSPEKSITVSVKEENKSSNANLKWLTVPSGCTLVPKFSKNVTKYTCTVPYSVTKFPMDWATEDPDATDSVTPLQTLKVGENTRTVTVTAPNGTKKSYTVTVIREQAKETPTPSLTPKPTAPSSPTLKPSPTATLAPITVIVNNTQYTVASSITLELPKGFTKEPYVYNSAQIEAAILGNVRLVQLFDGERDFLYVYDSSDQSFTPFTAITVKENTFTVLSKKPVVAVPLVQEHIVIDSDEYTGWSSEIFGEGYYLLNIVNNLGDNYIALYCTEDGSIQKLSATLWDSLTGNASLKPSSAPSETPAPDNKFSLNPIYIGIGACILILIAIVIVIIILIAKKAKTPKKAKRDWGFEDINPYNIAIDDDADNNEDFE